MRFQLLNWCGFSDFDVFLSSNKIICMGSIVYDLKIITPYVSIT